MNVVFCASQELDCNKYCYIAVFGEDWKTRQLLLEFEP
jgi:hypothetical protein